MLKEEAVSGALALVGEVLQAAGGLRFKVRAIASAIICTVIF
jgi:hypothetical protein